MGALGCKKKQLLHPAEARRVGPDDVEIVPLPGAPPKCLAFSVSDQGVVRMLVMADDVFSRDCPPGQPVFGSPLYVPAKEGKARVVVVFSDRRIEGPVVQNQLWDLRNKRDLNVRDLRLPEHAIADIIELGGDSSVGIR